MQEFIYYSPTGLDFPLSDQIFVTTDNNIIQNQKFLISNSTDVNSELVSQEVDFYIKNSIFLSPNRLLSFTYLKYELTP